MTKQIEAIYENGGLRATHPINIREGRTSSIDSYHSPRLTTNGNAVASLAEIAALPIEGDSDAFSGRDHDTLLYPQT